MCAAPSFYLVEQLLSLQPTAEYAYGFDAVMGAGVAEIAVGAAADDADADGVGMVVVAVVAAVVANVVHFVWLNSLGHNSH